jgi:glycerol-3-phosphate dehydrogenase
MVTRIKRLGSSEVSKDTSLLVFEMFASKIRASSVCLTSYLLLKTSLSSISSSHPTPVAGSGSYDLVVIGGGVVGLSVARSCAIQTNASILLIEKGDVVTSGVSARNSGLGCTGYDAPIGSLERRLLRRSIRRHQNLYRSFGLTHNHVRKCGSLVVAWNETELKKLPEILQENRVAGDLEAKLLTQEELQEFEPNISKRALGAVYCPYESVVEPWLVPMGYAESARLNGVEFQLG